MPILDAKGRPISNCVAGTVPRFDTPLFAGFVGADHKAPAQALTTEATWGFEMVAAIPRLIG